MKVIINERLAKMIEDLNIERDQIKTLIVNGVFRYPVEMQVVIDTIRILESYSNDILTFGGNHELFKRIDIVLLELKNLIYCDKEIKVAKKKETQSKWMKQLFNGDM